MTADLHDNRYHGNYTIVRSELERFSVKSFGITDFEGVCNIHPLLQCRNKARLFECIPKPESIIVCLFPYFSRIPERRNLSLYAALPDYHKVISPQLESICKGLADKTGYSFMSFTDNSPIPEVISAVRSGLGVRGDNGLLISDEYGSFVFIGEIITDMPLPFKSERIKECIHCGACSAACPSGYLSDDGSECLSAITQKKGELSEHEKSLILKTGIVWGCDECQLCCPMNKGKKISPLDSFAVDDSRFYITPDEVDARLEHSAFSFRGDKPVKRNLALFTHKA